MNGQEYNMLSNSKLILHFENDIQLTPIGETFQKNLAGKFDFEIVVSGIKFYREYINVFIKERGIAGNSNGIVSEHSSESVLQISDEVCRIVWDALSAAMETHGQPPLIWYRETDKIPFRLDVSIYDFVKRSRFGYFTDHAPMVEERLREKYPDVAFSFRIQGDAVYYYLIFHTEEDLVRAKELYGIDAIHQAVWEMCKENDRYHVFDEPIPMPAVTTKQRLVDSGEAMGIMHNNPKFVTLLTPYGKPQQPTEQSADRLSFLHRIFKKMK